MISVRELQLAEATDRQAIDLDVEAVGRDRLLAELRRRRRPAPVAGLVMFVVDGPSVRVEVVPAGVDGVGGEGRK